MAEILHLWALAPAAVGTCCMAADRRRARAPELAASALMLLAMIDLVRAQPLLAPVAWAALLLAAAMMLAGVRGGQIRRASGMPAADAGRLPTVGMTLSTAGGMVLMAAPVMMMGTHARALSDASMSAMAGMHSGDAGGLHALVAFVAVVYAAASGIAAVRAHTRLDRAQFAAMGLSTAIMTLAVIL